MMMITLVLAGLLYPAATIAASAPAPVAQAAAVQIRVGGYRTAALDDAGVLAAARFAAESVDGELAEVHEAGQQVVAGMNYKLTFSTTDGRQFTAIVFRALNRALKVTSIEEHEAEAVEE